MESDDRQNKERNRGEGDEEMAMGIGLETYCVATESFSFHTKGYF